MQLLGIEGVQRERHVEIYASLTEGEELGDLSPETTKEWAEVIRKLLKALCGEKLESNKVLRAIGMYRAKKYFRDQGLSEAEADRALEDGRALDTVNDNIRDGIWNRVKQTLRDLVKKG